MFSILSCAFQLASICAKTPASKRRKPGRWTLSSDDAYESEKRGGPDRIDLILVPPRELVERNELNAVARADGVRGVARHPRIGVGVAEPGLPTVVDITLQLGLEAANPVAA